MLDNQQSLYQLRPGSTIALVGNAPHLCRRNANQIDECEVVIRFNNYSIDGHEEFVGTKTNIWCFSATAWHVVKNQPNECQQIWVINRANRFRDFGPDIVDLARKKNAEIVMIEMPTVNEIRAILLEDNKALYNNQFIAPSSGIIAIHKILKMNLSPKIKIFGFHGFKKGRPIHYYYDKEAREQKNGCHDGFLERILLQKWQFDSLVETENKILL